MPWLDKGNDIESMPHLIMIDLARFRNIFVPSLLVLGLSSCDPATVGAMKWNAEQRTALSTVSVPTASVDRSGYFTPMGGSNVQAPIVQTGGGFAQGAAVNAGVALIFEVASGIEQKNFENKYGAAIQGVGANVPGDLDRRVSRALSEQLGKHTFFRGKVTNSSANRLTVTINRYGFVRSGSKGGETLVAPTLYGTWELKLASGKSLARQQFAAASPAHQKTVADFANNRALTHKAFDEAANAVANVVVADLNRRLGDQADHTTRAFSPRAEKNQAPVQLADVNPIELPRNDRYGFKQGFNRFVSQPNAEFLIDGHKLKIAATGNGGILFVMKPVSPLTGTRLSVDSAEYRSVRAALAAGGVGISSQANVASLGVKTGFIVELDGDGWSVLQKYRK